ncbi:deoxyribonuclease-2-alpha isoform X1 [Diprion similis]|uniref:deoxyribonuclease-2-alpha isoform X1 n=1 Tax=Diprion similis TaxID=362088 RepID=UPI001EF9734E|nr:deoxyribonuclease-2-alpha isoform X1 [Diprion similis]
MLMRACVVFSVFFVSKLLVGVNTQLQCKDERDLPVDWFVMYKLPKISQSSNDLIRKGVAYVYMTSNTINDGWKLSKKSIGLESSIPGRTLAPLYQQNDSILWTLYNDHAPNKAAVAKYGHSKGVVIADTHQGFWLVHSVPQYPPAPDHGTEPPLRARKERFVNAKSLSDQGYSYPKTGELYGQSFLCISVDKDQFDIIGLQLMYNEIITYKNNLPKSLTQQYPVLTKAANKIRINNAPYNSKTSIQSLSGTEFISFAKSDKWEKDLYDEFVAPQLGADLLAETWLHGPGRLPSDCSGAKVMNVKSINFPEANVMFPSSNDHSKWAVSNSANKNHNWVCIGDINRASTQLERGGGTVCLNSQDLWTSYRHIVNDVEACPKKWSRF